MWCAQVAFWFPFELALPAREYPMTRDGRRAMLAFDSGRCRQTTVVVPEAERPPRTDNQDRPPNLGPAEVPVRKVSVSGAPRFLQEVEEDIGSSFVTVSFEQEGDCPAALDAIAMGRLIEEALEWVGYFASIYRAVSWQVDVFAPAPFDVPAAHILGARNYIFGDVTLRGDFTPIALPLLVPANPRHGVGKPRLTEAERQRLMRALRTGQKLHVSEALRLEAWELWKMHHDCRLALVIANTAIETWLQTRVLEEYSRRSYTHHPGDADALVDVIPERNVTPLFQRYVAYLVGRDLTQELVYRQWRTDAYMPRNEVVHHGRMSVTDAEVGAAMEAIKALIELVERELTNARPP